MESDIKRQHSFALDLRLTPQHHTVHCGFVHDNVCMYIYRDVYVWVSVCVRGWVAKEGILSLAPLKRRWNV